MKIIGILYHPMKESAGKLAKKLQKSLADRGLSVWICSAWDTESARCKTNGTELILTIGGDGTILRAAQVVIPSKTPITGINLGNLGFLTELTTEEMLEKLDHILAGEGWIDERCLLEVKVNLADGERSQTFYALNDVVVARGEVARVIHVTASIDGAELTTYKADGVIVATATGSTGYALAAGGPILNPRSKDTVMLPIMPHLSANYCLVLPPEVAVRLGVQAVHPATISIDGHINIMAKSNAMVTIKRSKYTIRFLRIHPESTFYSSLEKRLKGKC